MTLVELLMVLGIIAIMLSLLLPAIQAVRTSTMRTSCQNNRHNLELGVHNFIAAHNRFPTPPVEDRPIGWAVDILPFVEAQAWYDAFRFDAPLSSPENVSAADSRPEVFTCALAEYREGAIAGIPAADYVIYVDPTSRRRHAKRVEWRLMDASLGTRTPWCFGPEISAEELGQYQHPHPAEGGLAEIIGD